MSAATDCTTVLEGISAYLDGECDAAACDAIEQHCHGCSSCDALVKGLRATIGLCRDAGSAPLPEDVRRRAQESVRRLLAGDSDRR